MQKTTMTCALATKEDAETLAALVNDAYRGKSTISNIPNEANLLAGPRTNSDAILNMLADDTRILVVKQSGGDEMLACVSVKMIDSKAWYLSMLAVNPSCQTRGLGKQILEEAEQYVRSNSGELIRISVINARESLIGWYERRGYHRTDEIDAFPYDDPTVGIPLKDDLELIILEKKISGTAKLPFEI